MDRTPTEAERTAKLMKDLEKSTGIQVPREDNRSQREGDAMYDPVDDLLVEALELLVARLRRER